MLKELFGILANKTYRKSQEVVFIVSMHSKHYIDNASH